MLIAEMKILRQSGEYGYCRKATTSLAHIHVGTSTRKVETLNAAFKRTKDHNSKSGNDNKNCAFQKELQDMFQGNPTIKPVAIATSSVLPRKNEKERKVHIIHQKPIEKIMRTMTIKLHQLLHLRESHEKVKHQKWLI